MTVSEERDGRVLVLGLNGKVDREGARIFMDRITRALDAGEQHILLDFASVAYVNSTGLRALILAAKRLSGSGGKLVLASVNDQIQKILGISGLSSVLNLAPTRAETLTSFAQ